jgi:integrase
LNPEFPDTRRWSLVQPKTQNRAVYYRAFAGSTWMRPQRAAERLAGCREFESSAAAEVDAVRAADGETKPSPTRTAPTRKKADRPHPSKLGHTVPAYRQRAGYSQALVTLTDAVTRRRKDFWLGEYGTPESRERYHRLIGKWEAAGRRLPSGDWDIAPAERGAGMKISELVVEYFDWAKKYYRPNEVATLRVALRLLRKMYGESLAVEFGPQKLRLVRESMIRGSESETPRRIPWTRTHCNHQCRRIRAMFKWASSHELVPVSVYHALNTIEPLKRGRTIAREGKRVLPAPMELVDGCRPFLSRQVNGLIDLQLLTGARCGELVIMRPIDIDMTSKDGVWRYRPATHKTEHFGKERVIYLGPRAQEVILPFLAERRTDQYIFSPAEAEQERRAKLTAARKTPLSCGNTVGSNRLEVPTRKPGDRYTAPSYYTAIMRACDLAFPPPAHLRPRQEHGRPVETQTEHLARLTPAQKAELHAWRKAHRWHPHQLRHNAGTNIRREFGLEAAQVILGHSSALITDAVYAERDAGKAVEVIRHLG